MDPILAAEELPTNDLIAMIAFMVFVLVFSWLIWRR